MTITLNGDISAVAASTILELLEMRGIDPHRPGVAVARNDRVVPRTEWSSTLIEDGDRIEIITAMQGG